MLRTEITREDIMPIEEYAKTRKERRTAASSSDTPGASTAFSGAPKPAARRTHSTGTRNPTVTRRVKPHTPCCRFGACAWSHHQRTTT